MPLGPFTVNKALSVSTWTESALLRNIKNWLGQATPPPPYGMGDDCAVLPTPSFNLVTTDCIIYKQHFDANLPPDQAGAKLLKRNLSDIAAMGGIPGNAVISLMLPGNVRLDWLHEFYKGLHNTALPWKVLIIGGDLAQTKSDLAATLTLFGTAQRPIPRKKAKPGDNIFVSGTLGGSILGKHYSFEPRLAQGQWLAKQPQIHSMIDISDGLLKDIEELLPSDCFISLNCEAVPISEAAFTQAQKSKQSPLYHALCDGEDYELVFSLDKDIDSQDIIKKWEKQFSTPLTLIAHVLKKTDQNHSNIIDLLTKKPLIQRKGFEHFSQ
jgi:thiamine-monophosphate kinase